MINYSIIIPHKNTSNLLDRCLASIPNREDIEIIVVDDGSSDEELSNLNKVISKYNQVRLLKTTIKKGAGHARNIALTEIVGRWILFADADDFFHKDWIIHVDKYKDTAYDVVYFDTDSCVSDTLEKVPNRARNISESVKQNDIELYRWTVPVVWGKLFSSEMIKKNNIIFDEVLASNDVMFSTKCAYYAKQITMDTFVLYCSTINNSSLCNSMNMENINCRVDVRYRVNTFLQSIGKQKYRGNLLKLFMFYRHFGIKVFFKKMSYYIKISSYKMMFSDLILSVKGLARRFVKGKNVVNNSQVITKDSFYK